MKRLILLFLLTTACCSSAFATLTVRIECDEELSTLWSLLYGSETTSLITDDTMASWNLTYDADPYVESWVLLTNKTSSAKTYTLTFTVDLEEAMPNPFYSGSVSGSLTTDPLGGYISTVPSEPLYLGLIDNFGILPFYPHLSSWSKPNEGTTPIDLIEAWGPVGGPVNETISIRHKFKLGAGDMVELNGRFEVVPEPATIGLLGLGTLLSLLYRNRRA